MIAGNISPLWDKMKPYLKSKDFLITGSGVRYGSVIYLGFGKSVQVDMCRRAMNRFPVELEIGADSWSIIDGGDAFVESGFSEPEGVRADLKKLLEGRRLHCLTLEAGTATLECSGGLAIEMDVRPDPASGFLIAFDVMETLTWESVDGVNTSFH